MPSGTGRFTQCGFHTVESTKTKTDQRKSVPKLSIFSSPRHCLFQKAVLQVKSHLAINATIFKHINQKNSSSQSILFAGEAIVASFGVLVDSMKLSHWDTRFWKRSDNFPKIGPKTLRTTIAFRNKGILFETKSEAVPPDWTISLCNSDFAKFSVKFNFIMLKIFSDLMVIIISWKTFKTFEAFLTVRRLQVEVLHSDSLSQWWTHWMCRNSATVTPLPNCEMKFRGAIQIIWQFLEIKSQVTHQLCSPNTSKCIRSTWSELLEVEHSNP